MFGLQTLDVALGLILVYLILSLICTAANELIAGLFKLRARNLVHAVQNLLRDSKGTDLGGKFFDHPPVKSLYREGTRPSYIPPPTFALALLDLVAPGSTDSTNPIAKIKQQLKKLPAGSDMRRTLELLVSDSENKLDKLRSNVETWFSDAMERAAGWYKRKTQATVLILSAIITMAANADTTQIAKALSNDPALRGALVAQAQEYAKQAPGTGQTEAAKRGGGASGSPAERIEQNIQQLQQLGLPLGWSQWPRGGGEWANKLIGLVLTTLAISLGAPFWFDLLKKVVNIRAAGGLPGGEPKARKS
jgi:hypothetical protein